MKPSPKGFDAQTGCGIKSCFPFVAKYFQPLQS